MVQKQLVLICILLVHSAALDCTLYETSESVCGSVSLETKLILSDIPGQCQTVSEDILNQALASVWQEDSGYVQKVGCVCTHEGSTKYFVAPTNKPRRCKRKNYFREKCSQKYKEKLQDIQNQRRGDEDVRQNNMEVRHFGDPSFWEISPKQETDKVMLHPKVWEGNRADLTVNQPQVQASSPKTGNSAINEKEPLAADTLEPADDTLELEEPDEDANDMLERFYKLHLKGQAVSEAARARGPLAGGLSSRKAPAYTNNKQVKQIKQVDEELEEDLEEDLETFDEEAFLRYHRLGQLNTQKGRKKGPLAM